MLCVVDYLISIQIYEKKLNYPNNLAFLLHTTSWRHTDMDEASTFGCIIAKNVLAAKRHVANGTSIARW